VQPRAFGSFFCLLTGFFKTVWVFFFYIIFIAGSIIVGEAVHTRNLGLMISSTLLLLQVRGHPIVVLLQVRGHPVRRATQVHVEATAVVEARVQVEATSTTRTSDLPPPGSLPPRPSSCGGSDAALLVQGLEAGGGSGAHRVAVGPEDDGRGCCQRHHFVFIYFIFLDL
jgi:hypothetical protein